MAFVTQNRRTVLSLNKRDFIRLHQKNPDHAGIIICSQDVDVAEQAERIHEAINSQSSLSGKLIRIHRLPR